MLSKNELIRYKRQMLINGWGVLAQEKLKRATVFIAGAGGLGSPVLFYLAVSGVGNLKICDFDRVELSNLNRQILHSDKKIGISKVDSAYETLININPDINIIRIEDKLTKRNVYRIIGEVDLIVDCLDNFQDRHILNEVSINKHIPMIHAGVSEFSGQITFLSPPETPCLECFIPRKIKSQRQPVVGATPGMIGSLQAIEAVKYLTGIGNNLKNKLLFWDGLDMRFEIIQLSNNPKCRICRV